MAVLVIVTLVNLRGIAHSARAFIGPTVVFVVAMLAVIVVGLFRDTAATGEPVAGPAPGALQTVGLLLLLRAFSNGCASLTGVEAIANAVPAFRTPAVLVAAPHRDLGAAMVGLLNSWFRDRRTFVLIAEVEPEHLWERILRNNRGNPLARAIRRRTHAIVCRLYFKPARLGDESQS